MHKSTRSNVPLAFCNETSPSRDQLPDEELLRRFVEEDDKNSFEALVRRYQHELFNYLCRYLGDRSLAEDVFQLTFVRVYERAEQFDLGRRFRPWLFSVATNQAIDMRRRLKHRTHHSLDAPVPDREGRTVTRATSLPDYRQSDQDALVEQEFREQVRDAVTELGEPGRSALELVYFKGLSYKEAAEILEVPVGTVKSRVHSAIRKLATVWERKQHRAK